ncbi:MAG: PD40 domain-containing protein, partial [Nitrososphaerota archaeon]|nr:PD40 domain-containing protein [Nitrososphaerota archaeon]
MDKLRNIKAEDIHNFKFVHEPDFSHDGKHVLFAVTQTDGDDGYSTSVWKYTLGGDSVSLFFNNRKISSLRWSKDGKSFLYLTTSPRAESVCSEIWVADSNGQDRRCVVSLENSRIGEPRWSPNSREIYFISDYDSDLLPVSKSDFKFVTRMNYRFDGDGVYGDRYMHIFKLDSKGE